MNQMQRSNENNEIKPKPGLVISYFGNSVAVEADDGQVFQCHLRRNQELPVVGDRVTWQLEKGDTGIILEIMPRQSLLARGDHKGKMKPIAANIDVIAIVMAPPPIFSEYLVDRYLVAAELLHIPAILVLNKVDLLDDSTKQAALARLDPYRQISYPVILSSIYINNGLDELDKWFSNKTAVLVGPSGVGKSSIISALASHAIRIREVTTKGAGKHTTTVTRLYHLPEGGHLVDSPGVREFNLWPVSKQDVLQGFKEFQPFSNACKFRDCNHLVEPGCAVQAAAADGKISTDRLVSYQTLLKQALLKQIDSKR